MTISTSGLLTSVCLIIILISVLGSHFFFKIRILRRQLDKYKKKIIFADEKDLNEYVNSKVIHIKNATYNLAFEQATAAVKSYPAVTDTNALAKTICSLLEKKSFYTEEQAKQLALMAFTWDRDFESFWEGNEEI